MPPSVPLNHYLVFQKPTEQKRGLVLLFHASLFRRLACVEHSNFFKVKAPAGKKQSTQNWHGPGESDCLIKTKHCEGR